VSKKFSRSGLLLCLVLTASLWLAHRTLGPLRSPEPASFGFQVQDMCLHNARLLTRFKRGEYTGHRATFDADTDAFTRSLLLSIQQFDAGKVPDVLQEANFRIAECHQLCLDSVKALRSAYEAEGEQRARLLQLSENHLKCACELDDSGAQAPRPAESR
jgi:hypothetical protein